MSKTTEDRIKILIIEDEPILAMELSDSLEAAGYDMVGVATNGRKALDLFKRQSVDLLLCDIMIKGDWDGIETVQKLTAERPVPVIYLTALTDSQTLERAKQTYPAAYLTKPYQLHSLKTAIDLAMHNFLARTTPMVVDQPTADLEEQDLLAREAILRLNGYLFIKQNYQFIKINLKDLLYLEADNTYTTLFTRERKYVLRLSLSSLLERINKPDLKPDLVRVHRSYAVNMNQVEAFNETGVSIGPQLIPLSRSYKHDFLRYFLRM